MAGCYNFGETTHKASSCPREPLHTRCPICNTAPRDSYGHKSWCGNTKFVRTYIGPSTGDSSNMPSTSGQGVNDQQRASTLSESNNDRPRMMKSPGIYELNKIIQFEFRNVNDGFSVIEGDNNYSITSFPLRVNAIDAFFAHGKELCLSMAYGKQMKRTLTLVSKDDKPIASFLFDETMFIVGNRIRIHANGNYSSNVNALNTISEGKGCDIRMKPWNEWIYFKVSIYFEPMIIDAQSRAANNQPTSPRPSHRENRITGVDN